jgi:hypothetical protein
VLGRYGISGGRWRTQRLMDVVMPWLEWRHDSFLQRSLRGATATPSRQWHLWFGRSGTFQYRAEYRFVLGRHRIGCDRRGLYWLLGVVV